MALDTVSKRYSAINVGAPWRLSLPIPDGTIGQGDRQHIAYWCSSVLFAAPEVAVPNDELSFTFDCMEVRIEPWNRESFAFTPWDSECRG